MDIKKIQMHEFIVNFMKITNKTEIDIYILFDAIVPVARTANVMLCDTFDNTLESLLKPVLTYPEHFELTSDAGSIALRAPEVLDELVKIWTVDSAITEAIKEYLKKYDFPMMYAGISLDYAAQNERHISSGIKYINWLWDRLEQNYKPNTKLQKDSCMGTPEDLANIARIPNLYILLSRYYSYNLMDYYGTDRECAAYVFYYNRGGNKRYFIVERNKTTGGEESYEVKSYKPCKNAPYFPDVVLAVPSELLEERKKVYEGLKKLFKKAKALSLTYDALAYDLGIIYGRIDDPRD